MGGRFTWLKRGWDRLRRFSISVFLTVALAAPGQQQERAAFLKVHNDARSAVGAAPLQWSDKLAAYAQEWAEQMAKSGKFEHRPNNPYGENLADYTSSAEGPDYAARLWLAEKQDYHGEKIDG